METNNSLHRLGPVFLLIASCHTSRADWQIVTSNTVEGAGLPSTSLFIVKMTATSFRQDIGSAKSMIAFSGKPERFHLFHETKTYQRLSFETNTPAEPAPPQLVSAGETVFAGYPVRAFSWTNAPEWGRIYVAPILQLVNVPTNGFGTGAQPTNSPGLRQAGSMFDRDSLVVGTEVTLPVPALSIGTNWSLTRPTNTLATFTSTLVSLTLTNLSPSEFEIPKDYREVMAPPAASAAAPTPTLPPPSAALFGRGPIDAGNFDALRKNLEGGAPPLNAPALKKQ